MGILTSKGEQLFSDHFSNIKKHDSSSVLVYTKKGIGLLDCETKTIIIPTKFNKIKNGAPGYHLIMKNNKWGVYSPKNEAILKPKYTSISYSKRNTVTTIKSKKATSYLLKDGSISELKPETLYAIKTTDSLDLNHDGDYVGFQKIPTRYHTIEKLKNGCYLARRKHVFNLCSYTGETFLKSDTWTAAKILDNQIMQVQTASSKVKYYNLQQMKWVYQNPEE